MRFARKKKEEEKKKRSDWIGAQGGKPKGKSLLDLMQPRFNDRARRKRGRGGIGKLSKASTCIEDNYIGGYRKVPSKRNDEKGQLASIISLSADL